MSKYVISYTNFFENTIQAECVEALDWREAIVKSKFALEYTLDDSATLEDAQDVAFNRHEMFNVLLIE